MHVQVNYIKVKFVMGILVNSVALVICKNKVHQLLRSFLIKFSANINHEITLLQLVIN